MFSPRPRRYQWISGISTNPFMIFCYRLQPHLRMCWQRKLMSYIAEYALLTLDGDLIENLEDLISEDEVAKSIANTPTGKSPGLDGLCQHFINTLLPFWLLSWPKYSTLWWRVISFPHKCLRHSPLIPKPDRDPSNCANRPISLIWRFLPRCLPMDYIHYYLVWSI